MEVVDVVDWGSDRSPQVLVSCEEANDAVYEASLEVGFMVV